MSETDPKAVRYCLCSAIHKKFPLYYFVIVTENKICKAPYVVKKYS